MARLVGLARILAIIGAILLIVEPILGYFNIFSLGWGHIVSLDGLISMIILVVIGVLVLIATGVIGSKTKVSFNGIVLLILGIVALVFGGYIGAVLVIIAGILLLL